MTRGVLFTGLAAVSLLLAGCTSGGAITPTVTSAGVDPNQPGYFIATGRVTGISENGGKCVFTFWAETGVATRLTGSGHAAGDHTECGPVSEPLGFMIGVNYEAELKYIAGSGTSTTSERVPFSLPRPSTAPN